MHDQRSVFLFFKLTPAIHSSAALQSPTTFPEGFHCNIRGKDEPSPIPASCTHPDPSIPFSAPPPPAARVTLWSGKQRASPLPPPQRHSLQTLEDLARGKRGCHSGSAQQKAEYVCVQVFASAADAICVIGYLLAKILLLSLLSL